MRTTPENSERCSQQHNALHQLIPKFIDTHAKLDTHASQLQPEEADAKEVQALADLADRLEAERVEIRQSVHRLLGKRPRTDAAPF